MTRRSLKFLTEEWEEVVSQTHGRSRMLCSRPPHPPLDARASPPSLYNPLTNSLATGPPGHRNRNPSEINNIACHPYRLARSLGRGGRPLPSPPPRAVLLSPRAPCTAGRAWRPGFLGPGRRGARGRGVRCTGGRGEGTAPGLGPSAPRGQRSKGPAAQRAAAPSASGHHRMLSS